MKLAACLAALLFAGSALAGGVRPPGLADVRSVAVVDEQAVTRVTIELSAPARFESHELANPQRLYIDVDGTWLQGPAASPQPGSVGSLLRVVRGGQNTLTRSRVVLELSRGNVATKVYTLQNPFRIVAEIPRAVRVAQQPAPAPVAELKTDVAAAPKSVTPLPSPKEATAILRQQMQQQPDWDERAVRRVVIDAGHGGKDPGAMGADQLREAMVVLAISRELSKQLTSRGFEVVLTRDNDVFLPLGERTDIANHRDADLFLSVHANAAKSKKLAGVETYLLDTRYDKQTARVAARENGTSVKELSDLHMLLASLKLGNNERYAARYANLVQSSLIRRLRKDYSDTIDLGVKRGPFLVLFQADMPAILVEVGFVSNAAEGRRMASRDFARAAAEGIADGVSAYREQQERRILARR